MTRPRALYVAEPAAQYMAQLPLVVDCSVIAAVLFDEAERDDALQQLSQRQLWAPRLLDHEIVNVAVRKQRQGLPASVVQRALADYRQHGVELVETHLEQQFAIAMRYELSAYDAAYLWLAAELRAPLATFDRKLNKASLRHLRSLE